MNERTRRSGGMMPIGKSVPESLYPPQFHTTRQGLMSRLPGKKPTN